MSEKKPVDVHVYLPVDKVANHKSVFDAVDATDKWMTNEIFKGDLEMITRTLRENEVLEEDEVPHFIYLGAQEGTDTRIEVPTKGVLNFIIRHDNRS
jgi:hypothetical protein